LSLDPICPHDQPSTHTHTHGQQITRLHKHKLHRHWAQLQRCTPKSKPANRGWGD